MATGKHGAVLARLADGCSFVEYETEIDLKAAVEKLDGREFKDQPVQCVADISSPPPPTAFKTRFSNPMQDDRDRGRDRYRSRSPSGRRGYPPVPYDDYYDRRGAPRRGYSPRREEYRRRSPPPRDYYGERYGRVSPRGRTAPEDLAPPRARYPEEPYEVRAPPPRRASPPRRSYEDPYANGHARPYEVRPPSPRGRAPRSPGRPAYEDGYAPRRYY